VTPVKQRRGRRPRTKGVAALEFALSLTFLAPLMGAAVDFGYYFYVGSSAEEAARAGVRQAVTTFRATFGDPSCTAAPGSVDKAAVITLGQTSATGEAFLVMNQPPLGMASNTQVQLTCDDTPVPASWHIMVRVDFKPAMGLVAPFMPAGTPGTVRYTARLVSD
jgi:Flp pilus assembly protein TadG